MLVRSVRRAFAPRNLITTSVIGLSVAGMAFAAVGSGGILDNSIRSIDIANDSLLSADIRDNSLLGKDLHSNTVTGREISEGTLQTVPTANLAYRAAGADKAADADKLGGVAASAYLTKAQNPHVSLRLNAGDPDVTVAQAGSIKVYARCTNTGGSDKLQFYVATTVDNAVLEGDEDGGDIDVATPETGRHFNSASTANGNQYTDTLYDYSAIFWSADGKYAISMDEGSGGWFFNYFGKTCGFDGEFHVYSA